MSFNLKFRLMKTSIQIIQAHFLTVLTPPPFSSIVLQWEIIPLLSDFPSFFTIEHLEKQSLIRTPAGLLTVPSQTQAHL